MRARRVLCGVAILLHVVLSGCSKRSDSSGSTAPMPVEPLPPALDLDDVPLPRSVVLVTIDGARWQDVLIGADPALTLEDIDDWTRAERLLPRIYGFLRKGGVALGAGPPECGVVRQSNASNISLPGYVEILGGRATACTSNACGAVTVPTVLDDAHRAGLTPVASVSSWELMDRAATTSGSGSVSGPLVSAGRYRWIGPRAAPESKLADLVALGSRATPFPAPAGDYRPDRLTASIALEYLRAHRPRLLHVGLGDPDEHAHRGDYPSYLRSLRLADETIADLADTAGDGATIIVTADHGRAANFRDHGGRFPESSRSFVIAWGAGVAAKGERCATETILLPDVGVTVRALLGLPIDASAGAGRPITEIAGGS